MKRTKTKFILRGADGKHYKRKNGSLWDTTSEALAKAMCVIAEKEHKQTYFPISAYV